VLAEATSADYVRDPTGWGSAEVAALFPGFKHLDMRTNGAVIRLRYGGSGPPLLLLHGNSQNHATWYGVAARLAQHPELDVVAGTTKPLWPKKPGFVARMRAVHELIPMTAVTRETIIFPTAIVAVRRKLFDRLGGFGFPDFDGAGEDTEFATRLSLAGAAGAYDPSWFTCHEVNEGFLALCDRYRRYGLANGRLIGLTTSPVAHDYMRTHWRAGWRTIWRWEYTGRRAAAHAAYRNRFAAIASATLATLVRLSYWRGVKEAFRPAA